MGADFLLYAVPKCQMTPKRLHLASQAVRDMSNDLILEYLEQNEGLQYAEEDRETACRDYRKQLLLDVEFLQDPFTRDVVDLDLVGCDRAYLFTGGMSWGDTPSDAAEIFQRLGSCDRLWTLLNRWAVEDKKAARKKNTTAAADC